MVTLKQINLKIKKGDFVCVIGDVGSGKSSLLSALIGDMLCATQEQIDMFGGLDKQLADKLQIQKFQEDLISNTLKGVPPIQMNG